MSSGNQAEWPITCSCGETWSRLEWEELPAIGTYDAGSEGKMELRHCVCGATLSIPAPNPIVGNG